MVSKTKTTTPTPCYRKGWTDTKTGKPVQGFWYLPQYGKQIQLSRYGAPRTNTGKADVIAAGKALDCYLEAQKQPEHPQFAMPADGPVLVWHVCQHFLANGLASASQTHAYNATRYLKRLCEGEEGKGIKGHGREPAAHFTPQLLDRWIGKHDWMAATIRGAVVTIKAAFSFATPRLISINPIAKYKTPEADGRTEVFTDDEEKKLRDTAEKTEPQFAVLFAALIELGARPGELAVLQARHWNEDRKQFILPPNEWKCGHKHAGKGGEARYSRYITLNDKWVSWVHQRLSEMTDKDFFFVWKRGAWGKTEGWNDRRWGDAFARLRDASGINPDLHLYDTRGSFITRACKLAHEGKITLAWIATQCGTSVKMIEKVYNRQFGNPAACRAVVDAVNGKTEETAEEKLRKVLEQSGLTAQEVIAMLGKHNTAA